jgi:hypothetical protein
MPLGNRDELYRGRIALGTFARSLDALVHEGDRTADVVIHGH